MVGCKKREKEPRSLPRWGARPVQKESEERGRIARGNSQVQEGMPEEEKQSG